jgi:hypothetical protein
MVFDHVTANETHIVTIAADGYEPFSATVTVGRDLISTVDVTLRSSGGVTVTTVPVTIPSTAQPLVTTVTIITGASSPATPVQTRSPLDAVPVLGAMALCGMVFLLWKDRK